jgi:hypothetical protein
MEHVAVFSASLLAKAPLSHAKHHSLACGNARTPSSALLADQNGEAAVGHPALLLDIIFPMTMLSKLRRKASQPIYAL